MVSARPELVITNPPPDSVRVRYKTENRGLISGQRQHGKPVELRVQNIPVGDLEGAICKAEVLHLTGESHGYYKLDCCSSWPVNISQDGYGNVTLKGLKLINGTKSGQKKIQKRSNGNQSGHKTIEDRGPFLLEFTIFLNDGTAGPTCRSKPILDDSYRETCRPVIKDINPRLAAGGEKVWLQCSNDVAQINDVKARFTSNSTRLVDDVKCDVEGRIVKFSMPCLDDATFDDRTEVDVKLEVHVAEDINLVAASDSFKLTYLSQDYRRSVMSDVIRSKRINGNNSPRKRDAMGEPKDQNLSRTFQTATLAEFPCSYTESSESVSLKCQTPDFGRNDDKAFFEMRVDCIEEKTGLRRPKQSNPPTEVNLTDQPNRKAIEDTMKLIPELECPPSPDEAAKKRQRCSNERENERLNFDENPDQLHTFDQIISERSLLANQAPHRLQHCSGPDNAPRNVFPMLNSDDTSAIDGLQQNGASFSEDQKLNPTPLKSSTTDFDPFLQPRNHNFSSSVNIPPLLPTDSKGNTFNSVYHKKDPTKSVYHKKDPTKSLLPLTPPTCSPDNSILMSQEDPLISGDMTDQCSTHDGSPLIQSLTESNGLINGDIFWPTFDPDGMENRELPLFGYDIENLDTRFSDDMHISQII